MKFLMLDIETTPIKIEHESVKEYLMDKKLNKEIRSLDPNYSKIITICLKIMDEPVKVFSGDDEKKILNEFWNFLEEFSTKNPFYRIVTHNGYKFDVPFIMLRSYMNEINIPKTIKINTNQWNMMNSNHFDTMIFFSNNGNFVNSNLYILATLNGIKIPENKTSGSEIERMYINKEWDKITEHCCQDVEVLESLFKKICIKLFE